MRRGGDRGAGTPSSTSGGASTWRRPPAWTNGEIAGELHARLARLGNDLDAMGRGLAKAVRSFNDGVGAYESRVMVSAARLAGLGAGAGRR